MDARVSRVVTLKNGILGTVLDGLKQKDYKKIYILFGINEIANEADYFKDEYGILLDRIEAFNPDAMIYIMAVEPVSLYKSESGGSYTMTRIKKFNEKLLELAGERGCYYIDLCEALGGEDGFLPASDTADGVHLKPSVYPKWLEYLRRHYI
jgi:lysophospholipase L1-like esterase